jgi:hypothetical protein
VFSRFFKAGNSGKQSAAVFVDYEHWYYGYNNIFSMKPNVEQWYEELTEEYNIKDLMFFGDFNGSAIEKELPRLEKISKNVVHTASTKDGVDKDFTDFIILDAIYRKAAKENSPEVFIIFTGDAHFNLAIKYLREMKKKVIVYGVKHSLSNKLKSSANSYVEMPRIRQEQQYYYDAILKSLYILKKRRKMATYNKTIENVSSHSGVSRERIQSALDDLMNNKYLMVEEKQYRGKKPKILKVNWKRLEDDGLWGKTE